MYVQIMQIFCVHAIHTSGDKSGGIFAIHIPSFECCGQIIRQSNTEFHPDSRRTHCHPDAFQPEYLYCDRPQIEYFCHEYTKYTAKSFFEVLEKIITSAGKMPCRKKVSPKSEQLLQSLPDIHVPPSYPAYFDLYGVTARRIATNRFCMRTNRQFSKSRKKKRRLRTAFVIRQLSFYFFVPRQSEIHPRNQGEGLRVTSRRVDL